MSIGQAPPWRSWDARSLQRQRWQRTAAQCATDADRAGEAAIADAFRRAAAVAEARPIGRIGRGQATRERALALGREGVHYRAIAATVGAGATTVRTWLAAAGVRRLLTPEERSAIQSEVARKRWQERAT